MMEEQQMNRYHLPDLIQLGHQAVYEHLESWAQAPCGAGFTLLDCTCGNGHDALFMLETAVAVGLDSFSLLAFDVQKDALDSTRKLLHEHGFDDVETLEREIAGLPAEQGSARVKLIHRGHESLLHFTSPQSQGSCILAMFNLGYLPGSDKTVVTRASTTMAALIALTATMPRHALVSVHAYGGHAEGGAEMEAVDIFMRSVDPKAWKVASYSFCNKNRNPEVLYLLQKL